MREFEPVFKSTFEDKLTEPRFTKEEVAQINNGVQSLTRCRDYNNHCLIHSDIPTEQTNEPDKKRVARMFRIVFDPKRQANIDGKHILYHGTKHDIHFNDVDGDDLITTVLPSVSSTTNLEKAKRFLTNGVAKLSQTQRDNFDNLTVHHMLAIHYDSNKHNNVPAVSVSRHSSIKTEEEVIMPPRTTFRHINTETIEYHPTTNKRILLHHVEPVYTHRSYDRSFKTWTPEQKKARV